MPESTQHKLDRVRPPRVQITYDVETRGSFVKVELPFVAGILADLSGNVPGERPALRDRKYVEIDRDNFNEIMKSIGPKIQVPGGPELKFHEIDDFSPMKVLEQLDEEKKSFDKRSRLSDMVSKLDGNVTLQQRLIEELGDATKLQALKGKVDALKASLNEKPDETPKVEEAVETPKEPEGGKK
jgi:type VI secretion system protein ImpB